MFVFCLCVSSIYLFQANKTLEETNKEVKAAVTSSPEELAGNLSIAEIPSVPYKVESNSMYVPPENWVIPKEKSFIMRYSKNTQAKEMNNFFEKSGNSTLNKHLVLNSASGSVLVTNVGIWEGQSVNVRINVSDYKATFPSSLEMTIDISRTTKSGELGFLSTKSEVAANALITYSFENQDGEAVRIGSYMALQTKYGTSIGIETNKIGRISAWDFFPAPYYYTLSGDYTMFSRNGASGYQPGYVGVELNDTTNYTVLFKATQNMPSYQMYSNVPGKIETPDLDAINQTLENVNLEDSVSVNYGQSIPYASSPSIDSYSWDTVIPDDPYYEFENITVKNWEDEDRTSFFDVTKDGDKLTISGNQVDKLEFYDDYYVFSANYKLKNEMVVPKDKLDENGYYSLSMIANSNLTSTSLIKFDYVYTSDVSVSPNTVIIFLDKMQQLIATVLPEEATDKFVTWSSSDSNIATVDTNGLVKAVKPGVAIITATTKDGSKATSEITVIQPVTGIELTPEKADLLVDKELSLSEKVVPDSAVDKSVTWSSSDETIAVVSTSGVVTGKGPGVVSITVKTNDGGFIATSEITVIQPVTEIKMIPESVDLILGKEDSSILSATVLPENASDKSVIWSSSDESIVVVSTSGVITGKSPGVANITVKTNDGGFTAMSEITVIQPVTGIKMLPESVDLFLGKASTAMLSTTVSPENASDKSITWSSSDVSIAMVVNGLVIGQKPGKATITATTTDGGYTATSEVTVIQPVTGIEILPESVDLFLGKASTAMLSTTVSPENASDKSITWSSSDVSIAMVVNGLVIGQKPGKATITATTTDGGYTATSEVTVIQPVTGIEVTPNNTELIVGGSSKTLIATVLPGNASDKSIMWSSSDESIVSVLGIGTLGILTANSPGTATITVTTNDGSYTATSEITVVAPYNLLQKVTKLDGSDADEAHLGEELIYETTLESLLPNSILLYKDFTLTAPIDESLEDITKIELKTSEGIVIGTAEYNSITKQVIGKVVETDQIREAENIVLSYHVKVKKDVSFGTEITGKTSAVRSYINGTVLSEKESNKVSTIVTAGELIFESAPAGLNFGKSVKLSSQEKEYPLEAQDGQLSIKDLRGNGNQWSLTAKMTKLLTHSSGKELPEAMYYRQNGVEQLISLNSAALIYEETTSSVNQVILSDKWLDPTSQSRPFVKVKGGQALKGEYQGVIQWTLQDVPNGYFDSKSDMP